ncbi:uncharacterized protein PHALS_12156 [Plasmopara halstedii]|uniref:Uncharacterized protein n=1 Tax=Plasmopara halstedii TaxID=4781 RepID=A0A0P1AME0_PLAHL|nr:uncharacterized protein PHALS_12156 [Plasmopara halstedii]CEG41839.1 hypothetical protein PHALS_12156 [Plasmopara halstedii]|eukprot:XP_024578208.1 hypothetical protein PHALS_12156 [Plasmopara halstedii]
MILADFRLLWTWDRLQRSLIFVLVCSLVYHHTKNPALFRLADGNRRVVVYAIGKRVGIALTHWDRIGMALKRECCKSCSSCRAISELKIETDEDVELEPRGAATNSGMGENEACSSLI